MLTKTQGAKRRNLKYLLLVPALLACTYLVATAQTKNAPAHKATAAKVPATVHHEPEVVTIATTTTSKPAEPAAPIEPAPAAPTPTEDNRVYENLKTPATYPAGSTAFEDYMKDAFFQLRNGTPDSNSYVTELSLLIDKTGKPISFNAKYSRPYSKAIETQQYLHPYEKPEAVLDGYMEKIISECPLWKPGTIDGKPVNSKINIAISGC